MSAIEWIILIIVLGSLLGRALYVENRAGKLDVSKEQMERIRQRKEELEEQEKREKTEKDQ